MLTFALFIASVCCFAGVVVFGFILVWFGWCCVSFCSFRVVFVLVLIAVLVIAVVWVLLVGLLVPLVFVWVCLVFYWCFVWVVVV